MRSACRSDQASSSRCSGPPAVARPPSCARSAGFNRQDSGTIRVAGAAIDHLPAHRRDIGMVFQDYAVFPHMTVEGNVAFGLEKPPMQLGT